MVTTSCSAAHAVSASPVGMASVPSSVRALSSFRWMRGQPARLSLNDMHPSPLTPVVAALRWGLHLLAVALTVVVMVRALSLIHI